MIYAGINQTLEKKDSYMEALGLVPDKKEQIALVGAGGKSTTIKNLSKEYERLKKKVICTTTTHIWKPQNGVFEENIQAVKEYLKKYNQVTVGNEIQPDLFQEKFEQLKSVEVPKKEERKKAMTRKIDLWHGNIGDTEEEKKKEEAEQIVFSPEKLSGVSQQFINMLWKCCDCLLIEADGARMLPIKVPGKNEPVIPSGTTLTLGVVGIQCLGRRIMDTAHRSKEIAELLGKEMTDVITERDIAVILTSEKGQKKNVTGKYVAVINQVDTAVQLEQAKKIISYWKDQPYIITGRSEAMEGME